MGLFSFVSLSLLIVALSLSGVEGDCLPNWERNCKLCYRGFAERVTWKKAERFCVIQEPDCDLVSIHTTTEAERVADYLNRNFKNLGGFWIGLNVPMKKGSWEWSDDSNFTYKAWEGGEPNSVRRNEFCVQLVEKTGYTKWNYYNCNSLNAFICQCRY